MYESGFLACTALPTHPNRRIKASASISAKLSKLVTTFSFCPVKKDVLITSFLIFNVLIFHVFIFHVLIGIASFNNAVDCRVHTQRFGFLHHCQAWRLLQCADRLHLQTHLAAPNDWVNHPTKTPSPLSCRLVHRG